MVTEGPSLKAAQCYEQNSSLRSAGWNSKKETEKEKGSKSNSRGGSKSASKTRKDKKHSSKKAACHQRLQDGSDSDGESGISAVALAHRLTPFRPSRATIAAASEPRKLTSKTVIWDSGTSYYFFNDKD
jgi:hypothetical protein